MPLMAAAHGPSRNQNQTGAGKCSTAAVHSSHTPAEAAAEEAGTH